MSDHDTQDVQGLWIASLRAEYGQWYEVWWEAGQYCAARRDTQATCRRGSPIDLGREIAVDYSTRPVACAMTDRVLVLERGLSDEARAVRQVQHPGWRLGLDVESFAWCAMFQYGETSRRWVYGPSLAALVAKLAAEDPSSE